MFINKKQYNLNNKYNNLDLTCIMKDDKIIFNIKIGEYDLIFKESQGALKLMAGSSVKLEDIENINLFINHAHSTLKINKIDKINYIQNVETIFNKLSSYFKNAVEVKLNVA